MAKGILEDPHFVGLGALGDHQLRTPLRKLWKSVKMGKRILQDPHSVGLGALGDHQIITALINVEKVSNW
jgi:hypothetical protein